MNTGFMNTLFGSAPLGPADWVLAGLLGVALFAIVEAEKWIGRGLRKDEPRAEPTFEE